MIDWIFLFLVTISGVLFAVGDILLKYWTKQSNPFLMGFAIILYIIGGFFLAYSFKRRELAVAIAVLTGISIIAMAFIGLVLFKETLGLKEIIGITLTLIAVIILST